MREEAFHMTQRIEKPKYKGNQLLKANNVSKAAAKLQQTINSTEITSCYAHLFLFFLLFTCLFQYVTEFISYVIIIM